MAQQEKENEKIPSTKGILAWVKEILHLKAPGMDRLPSEPAPEVITTLINKATGESTADNGKETTDGGQREADSDKRPESCPYALKRNIVESLREIRKFAEENDLAATMVRALLSLLAEMAVGALKGKVSGTILESLLKIFNYEREREESALRYRLEKEEAYRQGVIAGRKARIEIEEFPAVTEDVPDLKGNTTPKSCGDSIFRIASEA